MIKIMIIVIIRHFVSTDMTYNTLLPSGTHDKPSIPEIQWYPLPFLKEFYAVFDFSLIIHTTLIK